MNRIYLDNNATTEPTKEVCQAVIAGIETLWHNPSSIHRLGQEAKHGIEIARGQVAALLGTKSREVVFTGSGTEAIDLALRGTLSAARKVRTDKRVVITTPIEHSAVLNLCRQLEGEGLIEVVKLPVDRSGAVIVAGLEEIIKEHGSDTGNDVAIVSMQWVNNETGVIQPVARVGEICDRHNVVFHCDATQWVGKMPIDLQADDAPKIDLLSCSPHKFHGPKGVGVLWVRRGVKLVPTMPGSQELGRRGGTEPVPAILGAGIAAKQALEWVNDESKRVQIATLRDRLEGLILESSPVAVVNTTRAANERVCNTTNIGFSGLSSEAMLLSLSERGICVSAGSACASGSLDPSPVLLAMGVDEMLAHGSIRLSLSRCSTCEEIEHAGRVIGEVAAQLSRSLPA